MTRLYTQIHKWVVPYLNKYPTIVLFLINNSSHNAHINILFILCQVLKYIQIILSSFSETEHSFLL